MKEFILTGGKTLVDDEDYEQLLKEGWKWQYSDGYAVREDSKTRRKIKLCNWLLGLPMTQMIDHIDHNTANDQRYNLRPCTASQNRCNAAKKANSSSKYKGVAWNKRFKKWQVYICVFKKQTYLGSYSNEEEAARVYDRAAKELHEEFACLNFPE